MTPPAWAEPGARPELLHLTGAHVVFTWERIVLPAVWLAARPLPGGVSTIGAVARYGPPNDFNDQPTTKADFGAGGAPSGTPPEIPPDQSETPAPHHAGFEPAPWYRSPPLLIAWAVLVLILVALIVYGIGELIGGGESTGPVPSTTTTTTTAPSSDTTTAITTTPPPSTTTPTTPPTSTAVQPPPTQQQPTQQQPTQEPTQKHHPHLPQLPPGIRLPF